MRSRNNWHRGPGGSIHVGRSRIRLAKMLGECFPDWDVRPEDIEPSTGANRTSSRSTTYRWELYTRRRNSKAPVVRGCYDTIAACLKAGSVTESGGELHATRTGGPNER